jgi:hypothetical protein
MLKRRVVAALVVAIAAAGCSGGDDDTPERVVAGPLCDLLPSGDDPGAPETLTDETADVARSHRSVPRRAPSLVRCHLLQR